LRRITQEDVEYIEEMMENIKRLNYLINHKHPQIKSNKDDETALIKLRGKLEGYCQAMGLTILEQPKQLIVKQRLKEVCRQELVS
jgi:hypothetical protein